MSNLNKRPRPRGRYSTREATVLTGVSQQRIGQWARRGAVERSAVLETGGNAFPYDYQDIADILAVRKLRDGGAGLAAAGAAVKRLRESFPDWAFEFAGPVSGQFRKMLTGDGGDWTPDGIGEKELRAAAAALSRGGWAAAEKPLSLISVNPEIIGGTPAIRDRRISAYFVGETGKTEAGRETLRKDYEITAKQIKEARIWLEAACDYADPPERGENRQ